MVSFTYIIKDKFGIHARPGLLLVQEAGKLTSNITIFKGTDSGDAKRMFCVMNLAVKQGDQITVHGTVRLFRPDKISSSGSGWERCHS